MRLFVVVLMISTFVSASAYAVPTKLGEHTILINQLPSDVSQYWRECTAPLKNHIPASRNCSAKILRDENNLVKSLELSFILDQSVTELSPAILISELRGADEIYLNDKRIGYTGSFPPQFEDASYYKRFYTLPRSILHTNKPNKLRINYYHPATLDSASPFSAKVVSQKALLQNSFLVDHGLSALAAFLCALALIAFYHFLRIPNSLDSLGLAIFCLLSAVTLLISHQVLIQLGIDANSLLRWKTVGFLFAQLAYSFFLLKSFEIQSNLLVRVALATIIFLSVAAMIWPTPNHLYILESIAIYLAVLIPCAMSIYAFFLKREPLTKQQVYLASVVFICTLLFFGESQRQFIGEVFLLEKNTFLSSALILIAISGSITIIEKYWRYYEGATYDHLTGTLLQPAFTRRVSEEMQRCTRGAFNLVIIAIDIDQFKSINQSYGLDIGDRALVAVASKLKKTLRQFDLVCRLNDDEFCVAVTLPDSENVEFFSQRLHDEVNQTQLSISENAIIDIKATSGALVYDQSRHETPEMILNDLEHALTEAKMRQRGSIQWFDTDNPPLQFVL